MAANVQKLKLLYLMRLFAEKTDEEHGLTMAAILEGLAVYGITAERKSIYRDIEALREFGFDIRSFNRAPVEYAFVSRGFELDDLLLAIDAVQSCGQLTQRKADALSRGLKKLVSVSVRARADKRISVPERIAAQSDSVLPRVDRIQEAITSQRAVSFRAFRFDASKKRVASCGERYVGTPVELACANGRYYLVAASADTGKLSAFRLDRIDYLEILPEPAPAAPAEPAPFSAEAFEDGLLGAPDAETLEAELAVVPDAMDAVVDRFGVDVDSQLQDDGTVRVKAQVVAGPVLYGWLASLGGAVKVTSPEALAQGYKAHLQAALSAC